MKPKMLNNSISADLWVPSTDCPSTNCPFYRFDTSQSSTYKSLNQPFGIQYGIGSVNGTYVTDTVTVGGATIQNQQLGLAYNTEDIMQPNSGMGSSGVISEQIVANGILGMGYPSLTQANSQGEGPYNPFVFNLVSQGVIQDPVFSIYLNSISAPGWSGEIIFGGIDHDKFEGDLTYLPVAGLTSSSSNTHFDTGSNNNVSSHYQNYYYWMVYGQGLGVTNSTIANPSWRLRQVGAYILDTGTTLTYLPSSVAADVIQAIAGENNYALDRQSGVYLVDCGVSQSPARFELHMPQSSRASNNPVKLSVPASELVIPVDTTSASNASVCMFGIAPLGGTGAIGSNMYLIGDSVLRSAYMVFDMGQNRVGLAANKGIGGTITGGNSTGSSSDTSSSSNDGTLSTANASSASTTEYSVMTSLFGTIFLTVIFTLTSL